MEKALCFYLKHLTLFTVNCLIICFINMSLDRLISVKTGITIGKWIYVPGTVVDWGCNR